MPKRPRRKQEKEIDDNSINNKLRELNENTGINTDVPTGRIRVAARENYRVDDERGSAASTSFPTPR